MTHMHNAQIALATNLVVHINSLFCLLNCVYSSYPYLNFSEQICDPIQIMTHSVNILQNIILVKALLQFENLLEISFKICLHKFVTLRILNLTALDSHQNSAQYKMMTYYFQISKQEMIEITTANLGYSLMHECTVLLTKKSDMYS